MARFAAGVMAGFTVLHLVTLLVYKGGLLQWVPLFILDANRSSPVLFALGPAFALAGLLRAPRGPSTWAAFALLAAIAYANGTPEGYALIALAGVAFALRGLSLVLPVGLAGLLAAFVFLSPPALPPSETPPSIRVALERIRAETPKDALFVIPIGLFEFRHYAQRSAYVDFKLFSVAQPEQAALTRQRLAEVARPASENLRAAGWAGVALWEEDQHRAATCEGMTGILRQTGADYYLRRVLPDEVPPDCPALPLTIRTDALALYGPPV
jgi:hypothetical protein